MDDLVESILDYVRADYTDYAIMINGEWGSGKTYFWNNKIRSKLESMQINGKKLNTIYMSLYGISNLEEISKKIFIETTQLMDRNLRKYMNSSGQTTIPEYAKTGLDMANLFGVTQNGDRVDYKDFFSTDDKVLCFDDLERANVDVIDILGYINNFVEHDHIKTIIICNEKELSTKLKSNNLEMKTFIATYLLDKQNKILTTDKPMVEKIKETMEDVFDKANDYERIKEKLIGETFEYKPEFTYIINGILMRYEKYPELIRFLRTNTSLIISIFEKSGTRNLRILKHALADFKRIFDLTTKAYPNTNNRVLQTMLIFTIAVSFEIKAGKITKDKLANIQNNDEYKSIVISSKVFLDNRQFYIKDFDNNYYYNFKAEYRFFKFIEVFIRTRIMEMKVFKADMEELQRMEDIMNVPGYKRLLTEEYWKISDDEFPKVIEDVLDTVKNGKVSILDIVKLYGYFVYFINKGLIEYDMRSIRSVFINGLNIASLTSEYCENAKEELSDLYGDSDDYDMKEIIDRFYELNAQLKDRMYQEKAIEIFKNIPMKMEVFYDRFDKECMDVPIFKYSDPYQIFQRISCASNEDVVIIKEKLLARAKQKPNVVEQEVDNMSKLCQVIDDYISDKKTTIKTVILKEFSNDVKDSIRKYTKNSEEQNNNFNSQQPDGEQTFNTEYNTSFNNDAEPLQESTNGFESSNNDW